VSYKVELFKILIIIINYIILKEQKTLLHHHHDVQSLFKLFYFFFLPLFHVKEFTIHLCLINKKVRINFINKVFNYFQFEGFLINYH
jgi:hypothetical protein